jgi:hypothetical protein
MLKPEQYFKLYFALVRKNIVLINGPERYDYMHLFPIVYQGVPATYYSIKNYTPKGKFYPLHAHIDVEELKRSFDRFMVKDYVKSVKGTDFPKYFDKNTTQEEFDRWMEKFYEYRDDLLTGGICIKEFVDLKKYGEYTNECRVFYIANQVFVYQNRVLRGLFGVKLHTPPIDFVNKFHNLPSPFYCIDFAELEDDTWTILEVGDGGVSSIPSEVNVKDFYDALMMALSRFSDYIMDRYYSGKTSLVSYDGCYPIGNLIHYCQHHIVSILNENELPPEIIILDEDDAKEILKSFQENENN